MQLEVPTIRMVRVADPNGFVKGAITMYEVVDLFRETDVEPAYSAYTEREAEDFIIDWLEGSV